MMEQKKLPYNPQYSVSENGIITKNGRTIKSRTNGKSPHLFVEIFRDIDGKMRKKTVFIHRIVAELFIPKPSEKHRYVTVIDGDYGNCHYSNLKWITASEHTSRIANPKKSWATRRAKYGKNGGSFGRPKLKK